MVVEHYANFGTGEPWVSRLMIGVRELVFAVPAFGRTRDDFMEEFAQGFESLGMAFEEVRDLQRRSAAGAPALDLNRSYANLYGLLWQAYKDRFQKAMKALGVDIGFLFQNNAKFEKGAAALVEGNPKLTDLVDLMRNDRAEFQQALAAYRNDYLEHRAAQIDPRLGAFHRLDSAETTFRNVWQAIEDYVAITVKAHLPPSLLLDEIPESERDPARQVRFRFVLARSG